MSCTCGSKLAGYCWSLQSQRDKSPGSADPDGGWLAVVLVPASSANGKSKVTMQLWLEPDLITTDMTARGR